MKTISIITALACITPLVHAGSNLIKNGDFSVKSPKPWKIFAAKGAEKPKFEIADGVLSIKLENPAEVVSKKQLTQVVINLQSETKYKLTFDAKASKSPSEIIVTVSRSKDWSKGHYGLFKKLELSSEWKPQIIYFKTKTFDEGNDPVLKILFGKVLGDISFKNIRLVESKKQ